MNGCNEITELNSETGGAEGLALKNETKPIRLWLVDDNSAFRALLSSLLDDEGGFECAREFSSPAGVLKALAEDTAPDMILLDIEMGQYNGLDAIRPIKAAAPQTHVLMLTTFAGPGVKEQAFREGASDFMLKTWTFDRIAKHIRQAREFGAVAGLMTAFFNQKDPARKPAAREEIKLEEKSSLGDGWWNSLRGWLKFSPS